MRSTSRAIVGAVTSIFGFEDSASQISASFMGYVVVRGGMGWLLLFLPRPSQGLYR